VTEEQRIKHGVLVHGLEAYECAPCAVSPDPGCSLCKGAGTYFLMDLAPCGRADCPVGRRPE
jgi:hypothetical protein